MFLRVSFVIILVAECFDYFDFYRGIIQNLAVADMFDAADFVFIW